MKESHNILNDYKKGDFERRLFLFLECRSLRNEFVKIDHQESMAKNEASASGPVTIHFSGRKKIFYPFRRLRLWCHSFMN